MGDTLITKDDGGTDSVRDIVVSSEQKQQHPIEPFFYPQKLPAASDPEYAEFLRIRKEILSVIRSDTSQNKLVNDIVDALLGYEKGVPTDALSILKAVATLGRSIHAQRKKRLILTKVVAMLLEQVFDPMLSFMMTSKDILDAFECCGDDREKVRPVQIGQIYVHVLAKLKVGVLRDVTYSEQLHSYVRIKIEHIKYSRADWELNRR